MCSFRVTQWWDCVRYKISVVKCIYGDIKDQLFKFSFNNCSGSEGKLSGHKCWKCPR